MGNKMLIDATHPEETRVVVLRGSRVEEFDYESASKKQLRGNIYLAKVTRVEPSLQAAFVNYGGNRHGFLAFNEIHPDYYQLPLAERQALKQEEEQDSFGASSDSETSETGAKPGQDNDESKPPQDQADADAGNAGDQQMLAMTEEIGHADEDESADEEIDPQLQAAALEAALPPTRYSAPIVEDNAPHEDGEPSEREDASTADLDAGEDDKAEAAGAEDDDDDDDDDVREADSAGEARFSGRHTNRNDDHVESVGSEDALEELPHRHRRRRRSYKIQEVIRRGQIMLIQVVKEERGNKGAALTTYLSLAGRYTVLMPNTGSGGGISRKISSPGDRKRLREIAAELDVASGMGLIIRTAGAARTKTEIKRDYEYLLRLWENVRDLTLKSSAPCLVYEEGDLIKRSIRDLYNREIDEVLVAGDDAYRDAKDFMRMLMPSHAKNVQPYKDPEPIFTRHEVERQLNAMFSPQVTLPSGGYIIINQTEALVAIDINSGKATREYSIEDTALKTNLEAAEEIARQLRLRDLAGLIVADFIDMEEKRNNRAVERRLKECLHNDRARIQVGRISPFGLLEMSRQRLRTGMVEGSTSPCQHCQGTGVVRSTESVALSVLRSLEDWLRANTPCNLNAVSSTEVSLYILNQKRSYLRDIESRHGVTISVAASERMHGANFYIEKVAAILPATGTAPAAVTQSDRIIQPFESDDGEAGEDQGR
ncbi:MAG: Rne/Rng family ribonuclease, partial [Rhodomicrobiaceae bacterium]